MPKSAAGIELVRRLALELPDVQEGAIHGHPSWELRGKLLACRAVHTSTEPDSLLVKIAPGERTQLLAAEPETYYVTDHYRKHPVVLVRLAEIDRRSLQEILRRSWEFLGGSRSTGGKRPARKK
jgi:hypothetical protein